LHVSQGSVKKLFRRGGEHWILLWQDTVQQISSESCRFYGRYDKNIATYFLLGHIIGY